MVVFASTTEFSARVPRKARSKKSSIVTYIMALIILLLVIYYIGPQVFRSFMIIIFGVSTKAIVLESEQIQKNDGNIVSKIKYKYEGMPDYVLPARGRICKSIKAGYTIDVMYVPRYPRIHMLGSSRDNLLNFIAGIVFIIIAFIVNLLCIRERRYHLYLVRFGTAATGRIIDVQNPCDDDRYGDYYVTYEFRVNNSWVHRETTFLRKLYDPKIGDEILILYDPKNPSINEYYERLSVELI